MSAAVTEEIHDLAIELGELDGMAGRVFEADDWLRERDELRARLENAQARLSAIVEEVA